MSKLICDICGTSYSDTEPKCPTCGYSRAFQESSGEEQSPVVRERVRGGRFSKKNVRKRLKDQARQPQRVEPNPAFSATMVSRELAEEMRLALAAEQEKKVDLTLPASVPAPAAPEPESMELPQAEEPVDQAAALENAFAAEEAKAEAPKIEEAPAEEESEPEVIVIPEEAPVEEEPEVVEEIPEEIPVEEESEPEVIVIPEEAPVEEEPEVVEGILEEIPVEEEPEPEAVVIPLEVPAEEEKVPAETSVEEEAVPETEDEEPQKKKKGGLLLNIILGVSLTAFILSAVYLLVQYGLPYLQTIEFPTQAVAETTVPTAEPTEAVTQAPTQAPTEAPTAPPTEPPTEAPTEPPTEPPTEAPTDPPALDIPLTLNYYELTFRGGNQGVQLVVDGYDNADITWTSDDPDVVTISDTGFIISVGNGTTHVHATYSGHTVSCVVYCKFS